MKKKVCPRCRKQKPTTDFYNNARTSDRLDCYCMECRREYTRQYMRRRNGPVRFPFRDHRTLAEADKDTAL